MPVTRSLLRRSLAKRSLVKQSRLRPRDGAASVANSGPTAAFSSVVTGLSVAFTDESTDSDGTIASWDWDFGDGTAHSTEQHPVHVYTTVGNKTVTLVVTDNGGATDDVSHTATPVVGKDGPSTAIYLPQTAAQWVAIGLPAPNHLWLCQDASGNLAAAIGATTLTANGTPLYQQSVANWAAKAVGTVDNTASQRFASAGAGLDYASGESVAWLTLAAVSVSTGTRRILPIAADGSGIRITSGGLPQTVHGGVVQAGAADHRSALVRPWLWYRNATTNVSGSMTVLESIVGTHEEAASAAQSKGIGAVAATTAPTASFVLVAFWKGADAETIAAKATLTTLGYSVAW